MADGPSLGTAYVRVAGDFTDLNSKLVGVLSPKKLGTMGKVAGGALAAGVVAAGVGKVLYDIGQQFDDATDTIRTQTGATGKELDKLKGSFKSVVSSVPTDFDTAAKAVAGLNQRLDLTGKPLERLSKQLTALSEITGSDIQENVESVTRLFGDWSVKTGKQSETLDRLFRLTQETGIGFSDLSRLMVQFGSPLRQLGFRFNEAAAMFARFEREGVNMQTLLPGLRYALKNISIPTAELGKQFKSLGINTRDPHEALLQIFDVLSADKISEADQTLLASGVFGGRAWTDMKAAVEEGRFEFEDLIATMKGGDASIRGTERATRDFSEQWMLFKNRVMVWLEPLATKVFGALGTAMAQVNRALKGKGGFAGAISDAARSLRTFWEESGIVRKAFAILLDITKKVWAGIVDQVKGAAQVLKGVVKVISGVLTGNFGRAWDGVKDIFRGAVRGVIGILKQATGPLRGAAKAIGSAIGNAFSGAWDRIKDIFRSGAGVLKDIVNWIISNVINRIPGVELGTIGGEAAGGGGRAHRNAAERATQGHARGGVVTKPMAIVGEEAPQHPEFVLATNPAYRKRNLALWGQAGKAMGVPGFALGGIIDRAEHMAGSGSIPSPGDLISKMAGAPFGGLPSFMSGTGEYVKDKFAAYIRDKVSSLAEAAASVVTGGMKGVSMPEGGSTLAIANRIMQMFGLSFSSGYRSPAHNAAVGGVANSLHTHGSPSNPGAIDLVGSVGAMQKAMNWARSHLQLAELLMHDVGSGLHLHLGFFKKGGILQGLARGGTIGRPLPKDLQKFNRVFKGHKSPDYGGETMPAGKVAKLAEFFGMPGVAMAQIARGESNYRPGAIGDDAAAGYGNTLGYGLWQITTGASGMDSVVKKFGGYGQMLNPIKNAIVAAKMFKARGTSPWFGTQFLTDAGAHWGGEMGRLVRAGHGGGEAKKAAKKAAAKLARQLERRRDRRQRRRRRRRRGDGAPDDESELGRLQALNELLSAQLLDTRQNLSITRAQMPVFNKLFPYAGSFGGGGTVPGPIGAPRAAIVHGGEEISGPGGQPVYLLIEDGAVDERRIRLISAREYESRSERDVRRARARGPQVGGKAVA